MNSNRAAFVRLIATALAIVLITLGVLGALGTSYLASLPLILTGKFIANAFRYLPWTLELIAVSFVVASIVGFAFALVSGRLLQPVVTGIALVVQCIPFFVLAIAMEFVGIYAGLPIGGHAGNDGFNLGSHLSRLILPAGALTLFQLPPILEYFSNQRALGESVRATAASMLGGLAVQFARNLPDLITATIIAELVFAWRGEGSLFWSLVRYDTSAYQAAGLLLFMALSVLIARFVAEIFTRRTKGATESHV